MLSLEEGKNIVLLLVRLKVGDKKITEIETQVTRMGARREVFQSHQLKRPERR